MAPTCQTPSSSLLYIYIFLNATPTSCRQSRKTDRHGGRRLMTSRSMRTRTRTKTHSLCVADAAVGVLMVPHISPRVGLWEPRCHFLSRLALANPYQISSGSRPIAESCDEAAQITISTPFPKEISIPKDLNCARFLAFPPKIVIWDGFKGFVSMGAGGQGSFCFRRNYGLFSSARLFPPDL